MVRKIRKTDLLLIAILIIGINLPLVVIEHYRERHGVSFFEGTWEEALETASKENKPIFLNLYSSFCIPCKIMNSNTYPRREAGDFFKTRYINFSVNRKSTTGQKLSEWLKVEEYPALLILDPTGDPVLRNVGKLSPGELVRFGKEGLERMNHHQ